MKIRLAVAVVGLTGLGLGFVIELAAAPTIKFDQTTYDFGTTSRVTSVTGTFTFQNAGDEDLKIQRPTTSCGCTVAGVKPDLLKPGEKGELVFTLSVGHAPSKLQKTITVPSNDPETKSVVLTIKADVQAIFSSNPMQFWVRDLLVGATTNQEVQIKRVDGKPLGLSKTETSSGMVTVTIDPAPAADAVAAKLLIAVKSEGAPRRFNEQVRVFSSDDPKQPALVIPVIGRVLGDVDVQPERLSWIVPERATANRPLNSPRQITIVATRPDEMLEVKNLTSSLKEVELELVTLEAGKRYAVVAKLPKPLSESTQGKITFETNLPTVPKVEVPVNVTVFKR